MEPIIVSIPGKKSPEKAKEEALLASCKYYKGEDGNPFPLKMGDNRHALWYCEKSWVDDSLRNGDSSFASDTEEYLAYGANESLPNDSIPISLRARIFSRFAKGSNSLLDAARDFPAFYGLWYGDPAGA
jgi:hypothetical protein